MQKEINRIKARDGALIYTVTFKAEGKREKGFVIVSHGFGEHADSYDELAGYLTRMGYACVLFDQRGHGRLEEQPGGKRGKRQGVIPAYHSFLDDIDDVAAATRQTSPDAPLALYGHSMGGNIVLNYLLARGQSGFACAVLESPWLGLYKGINPLMVWLAAALGNLSSEIAIINKLKKSDVTDNEAKARERDKDPFYHNRISMRMFSGINGGCAYALSNAHRLAIPTYLAYAKNEKIVSNQATREFSGACGPNITMKEYDSHHAIHSDANRERYFQDVVDYLDQHCDRG